MPILIVYLRCKNKGNKGSIKMVRFANPRNVVSCNFCGDVSILDATDEEFAAWDSGMLIQDAMPRLSVNDREMLISGCCPKCWDKMWPPEDEEVDI